LLEVWKNFIIVPIYKMGDKEIIVIIVHINVATYVQNFIQNPVVKVKSTCRQNYCETSISISTQQVNTDNIFCVRHILETKWECGEEFIICL